MIVIYRWGIKIVRNKWKRNTIKGVVNCECWILFEDAVKKVMRIINEKYPKEG